MIIRGISVEKIKNLTEDEWNDLDLDTKKEYEYILSNASFFSDDFIDEMGSSGDWLSDIITEYLYT